MIDFIERNPAPFSPNAFVPIPYAARYNHIDACPMGQASIWLYLAAYGMGTKAFGENGAGFLSMKSIIGYKRQGIPGG